MPNYDYAEFIGRPASERFPEWALGSELWRQYGDRDVESLRYLLNLLVTYTVPANRGKGTPQLFVSHRQIDDVRARQIAKLARTVGFQTWLDAEDAVLSAIPDGKTISEKDRIKLAGYIETALLNSTHVIAVITKDTTGSKWVPYEYGRIKDRLLNSRRAGCWIHPALGPNDLGEYLLLGVRTDNDSEIAQWLQSELASWNAVAGAGVHAPAAHTPAAHVQKPDLDRIARESTILDHQMSVGRSLELVIPPPEQQKP